MESTSFLTYALNLKHASASGSNLDETSNGNHVNASSSQVLGTCPAPTETLCHHFDISKTNAWTPQGKPLNKAPLHQSALRVLCQRDIWRFCIVNLSALGAPWSCCSPAHQGITSPLGGFCSPKQRKNGARSPICSPTLRWLSISSLIQTHLVTY